MTQTEKNNQELSSESFTNSHALVAVGLGANPRNC